MAILFQFAFDPAQGMINGTLKAVGFKDVPEWLGDPNLALWVIMAVLVWCTTGFFVVLFSAGMASIPKDFYEAALLDGASRFTTFFRITLPRVRATDRPSPSTKPEATAAPATAPPSFSWSAGVQPRYLPDTVSPPATKSPTWADTDHAGALMRVSVTRTGTRSPEAAKWSPCSSATPRSTRPEDPSRLHVSSPGRGSGITTATDWSPAASAPGAVPVRSPSTEPAVLPGPKFAAGALSARRTAPWTVVPATWRLAVLPVRTRSPPTVLPHWSADPSLVAPISASRDVPVTDRLPPTTAPPTLTPKSLSPSVTSPFTLVRSRSTYVAACVERLPEIFESEISTSTPPAATLPPTRRSYR
ncbi:ABC transporter permease subunit [Oerskovia enterophila]